MTLHLLPRGQGLAINGAFVQRRDARRRRRRRRIQQIRKNPVAAQHGGSLSGVRSHRQDATLPKNTAALAVLRKGDPPKAGTRHVGNAVMFCQASIEERVLRPDEIHDAAVLANHATEKQARFFLEGAAEAGIKLRIDLGGPAVPVRVREV